MFDQLLFGIDDSPSSAVAVDFVSALARQCNASVHVLFVNERLVAGRGLTLLSRSDAAGLVGDVVLRLRQVGIRTGGSVHVADHHRLAACIVEVARDKSADAIVLGSRRHRPITRLFAGGVRDRVTRATCLPVVVAPPPLAIAPEGRLDLAELWGRRARAQRVPSR